MESEDNIKVESINKEDIELITVEPVKKKRTRRKKCPICEELFPSTDYKQHIASCKAEIKASKINDPYSRVSPGYKQPDEKEEEEEKEIPKMDAKNASINLYNLQFSTYLMLETTLNSTNNHSLDGLTEKMEAMKESYLMTFEQIYEEYGSDYLDQVLSPVVLWAMLSTNNFASVYIENKKKSSSEKN